MVVESTRLLECDWGGRLTRVNRGVPTGGVRGGGMEDTTGIDPCDGVSTFHRDVLGNKFKVGHTDSMCHRQGRGEEASECRDDSKIFYMHDVVLKREES